LILDRTEAREDGARLFIFEHTDEKDRCTFLRFAEAKMPAELAAALHQGDVVSAEWSEDRILSGVIDREATEQATQEADNLLAKLFAKGKKK
jgi:hypothetical protein